jgi:hypothetical protein
VFEGTANDSYAEVVGTPGRFTGCIAYRSNVLFFKEDLIHILYGKRPSAYQLDTLECVGLEDGAFETLAIANETLFYKGKYGVYAYNGGLPELISEPLGSYNELPMTAGGSDGMRYYITANDRNGRGEGTSYVFSYDTRRGIWSREDNRWITDFADVGLNLYFIEQDEEGAKYIGSMTDHDAISEDTGLSMNLESDSLSWSATTGWIGLDTPDEKYISRIRLRLDIPLNSVFIIEAAYDNDDTFTEIERVSGNGLRPVFISITPQRCDTMRLRFRGKGDFKLYSVAKEYEQGSDSY